MRIRSTALAGMTSLAVAAAALAANPRGAASAKVGGKDVRIDYGRPALKGRSLEELTKQLPADRIWRAGENQVTTLSSDGPLSVAGKTVPAGRYSLYVHAGDNAAWSLVLNKDLGVPLGEVWTKAPENMKAEPWPRLEDYTKAIGDQEVVRAVMAPAKADEAAELFTITLAPKGAAVDLTLAWGTQAWSIALRPAN